MDALADHLINGLGGGAWGRRGEVFDLFIGQVVLVRRSGPADPSTRSRCDQSRDAPDESLRRLNSIDPVWNAPGSPPRRGGSRAGIRVWTCPLALALAGLPSSATGSTGTRLCPNVRGDKERDPDGLCNPRTKDEAPAVGKEPQSTPHGVDSNVACVLSVYMYIYIYIVLSGP